MLNLQRSLTNRIFVTSLIVTRFLIAVNFPLSIEVGDEYGQDNEVEAANNQLVQSYKENSLSFESAIKLLFGTSSLIPRSSKCHFN